MTRHKNILLLLIVSLLTTFLNACGDPTATIAPTKTPASTTTAAITPTTITWSFWGSDDEIEINKKLIDQFEKLNPSIKVKPIYDTWENYYKRLANDWVGDKTPDVMFLENVTTFASQGTLESLDQYLANDKAFKLEDFYPGLIKQNQYQGKLYGLPRDNDTKVIFANKKLFSEAGVALPKSGWTWNELRTSATKLTKRDDSGKTTQYGYAFEPNDWWRLWIWQNGGDIFDNYVTPEPPTHLTVNTPEAIEAIQFFSDLINKDKVSPAFDMMDNSDKISELFINNQVAMAFGNHALVPLFSKTKDLDWEVIPLPAGKKRVNILDGASYTINQKSTNKAAAWQFVKFLSSELGQGFFMESGVVVPARQSIREDNIFVQRSKYNWQIFIEETQFGKPTPQFRSFNSISKLVDQELEAVWKGQKTSVAVLSTLGSKIDPELAKLKG